MPQLANSNMNMARVQLAIAFARLEGGNYNLHSAPALSALSNGQQKKEGEKKNTVGTTTTLSLSSYRIVLYDTYVEHSMPRDKEIASSLYRRQ